MSRGEPWTVPAHSETCEVTFPIAIGSVVAMVVAKKIAAMAHMTMAMVDGFTRTVGNRAILEWVACSEEKEGDELGHLDVAHDPILLFR